MRLQALVSLMVVILAAISPLPVLAKADTAEKVVAGLMVINALRGTSDSELHRLGNQLDEGLVRQYGTTTNGLERVQRAVNRLEVDPAKRPQVRVLESPEVNAMAVPGYIYATSALVSRATDDQLAGVMGHELSHISAGHCKRAINRARLAQGIGGALTLANANDSITAGVSLLALVTLFDYSRGEEYEADRLGASRAAKAGYNADGLASFLEGQAGKGGSGNRLLASHPETTHRVAALREGTVGSVHSAPTESPAPTKPTKTSSQKAIAPRFSVSFTGFASEEFRRGFMIEAETQNQPVDVRDWGGDYQVVLTGDEVPTLNVSADVSGSGRSGYARGGVSDIITWKTVADIKSGSGFLATQSAAATGARTYLHMGTFSQRGSISLDVYNAWLGQSLQGKTLRALVPKVLRRLQDEEGKRQESLRQAEANRGSAPAATYRYTMFVNGTQIQVRLGRSLSYDSQIGIYKKGRQIGTLKADYFDAAQTKVWVSGDLDAALERGVAFKSL